MKRQLHLKGDKNKSVCRLKTALYIEGPKIFLEHLEKDPKSCCSICVAKGIRKRIILNGKKMESNTEDYKDFFVHFEEVTGHDFEYSLWSWERKLLPVFFVWENFDIKVDGTKYLFYKGDRFSPYKFSYDKFKSIYRSGLIGTTPEKPESPRMKNMLSMFFVLMIAFGFLGLMVFMMNEWVCILSSLIGIVGLLSVNYEDVQT